MDSDAFAVWDDPAPASASSTTNVPNTTAQTSLDDLTTKENLRLSLEYEDEDPGWGAPSGSASRAGSPEKSRKQPSPSRVHSVVAQSSQIEESASASKDRGHSDTTGMPEEGFSAETTIGLTQEAEAADFAAPEASPADSGDADDDIDTFEDSRQEQVEHDQDDLSSRKYDQKATTTAPSADVVQDDDGFDDFDEAPAAHSGPGANDDFGDFDDFETGAAQNDADFGDDDFGDDDFGDDTFDPPAQTSEPTTPAETLPAPATVVARHWTPLDVTNKSNRIDLAESVKSLFPLASVAEQHLSNVGLRQVDGPSQVLVSGESRQLWIDLTSFPSMQPIDWVRSRTRRDYLISMGVPVNLDEIHSSFASGSGGSRQMPTLQLKYESPNNRAAGLSRSKDSLPQRSSSLKAAGNGSSSQGATAAQRSASTSNSPRNGNASPALGSSTNRERIAERRMQELGLGPTPQVDLRRAQELVSKTEDQLTLLSLPALKSMQRELNTMTTSASSLLTHHLTLRESYQADSEMYNSMIKDLVTGAASRISGGGGSGGGDSRRSNTIGSGAGNARVTSLPARSMSPSIKGGASPRR